MKNKQLSKSCPECGSTVDIDRKTDEIAYCSHCGVRFLIVIVAGYRIELIPLEVMLKCQI